MTHTVTRRHVSRGLLATALSLVAGACTNIVPGRGEPPKLYTLSPKSTFSVDLPEADWQLVIEVPVTIETLDTPRIALRQDPLTLDYYAQARWSERAPILVQTLLVESFENSGKIVAVARQATDLRADYVLKSDLREFQAEYFHGPRPRVRIRLNAKLVQMPQRTIIASKTVEQVVEANGDKVVDVVYAFDEALGKVMKAVVEWALRTPT